MDLSEPNNDPNELDPQFRTLLMQAIAQANDESVGKFPHFAGWHLYEGYRSQARQDWLYAQGRTRPGPIVTELTHSNHTSRKAADVVWYDAVGEPHWDGPNELWQILGHAARTFGLKWGGDWIHFKDLPHIELR